MDIRPRPLVIATAVGLVPLALYTLGTSAISYFAMPNMMQSIDPTQGPDPQYFQLTSILSMLGCLGNILTIVLYALVGVVYANLHGREADVSAEEGAIGGAIGAGLVAFIVGLIGAMVSLLIAPAMMDSVFQSMQGPVPPEVQDMMGYMIAFAVIGSAFSLCFSAFGAALVGALGGAVGAAVRSRRAG